MQKLTAIYLLVITLLAGCTSDIECDSRSVSNRLLESLLDTLASNLDQYRRIMAGKGNAFHINPAPAYGELLNIGFSQEPEKYVSGVALRRKVNEWTRETVEVDIENIMSLPRNPEQSWSSVCRPNIIVTTRSDQSTLLKMQVEYTVSRKSVHIIGATAENHPPKSPWQHPADFIAELLANSILLEQRR